MITMVAYVVRYSMAKTDIFHRIVFHLAAIINGGNMTQHRSSNRQL